MIFIKEIKKKIIIIFSDFDLVIQSDEKDSNHFETIYIINKLNRIPKLNEDFYVIENLSCLDFNNSLILIVLSFIIIFDQ
jgi:hypothetical protein